MTAVQDRAVFSCKAHHALTAFPGETVNRNNMSGLVFPVDRMTLS